MKVSENNFKQYFPETFKNIDINDIMIVPFTDNNNTSASTNSGNTNEGKKDNFENSTPRSFTFKSDDFKVKEDFSSERQDNTRNPNY